VQACNRRVASGGSEQFFLRRRFRNGLWSWRSSMAGALASDQHRLFDEDARAAIRAGS
jgi:hypothetical protein